MRVLRRLLLASPSTAFYEVLVVACFGTVRALVWGAYGEASDGTHQLCEAVVAAEATRSWRRLGARSQAEARSYLMSRTRRSWGIHLNLDLPTVNEFLAQFIWKRSEF